MFGVKQNKSEKVVNFDSLSNNTLKKGMSDLCKTQILISTKGENKRRDKIIADAIVGSYGEIKDDNEFICRRVKKKWIF